jgi:hypothetical protein
MKNNRLNIFMISLLALACLILGALYIWAPVCDGLLELKSGNMVHMKCFYTSQVTAILALLLILLAATSLIKRQTHSLMIIALGIMLIVVTYTSFLGIGVCVNEAMACNTTALWIRGGGALTILFGLGSLILKGKKEV